MMYRFLSFLQFLPLHLPKDKKAMVVFIERFLHYSGLKFIYRKFVPADDKTLPTGIIWAVGLYFAIYAFTAQRYESELDKIEFKYNVFTTQIGAGAKFSNNRLMGILNETIPVKPSVYNPISIFKSFIYGPYAELFYQTYADVEKISFKSASAFRQEIIRDWNQNLKRANFFEAQLNGASFFDAQGEATKFHNAQLKGADFSWAKLKGAKFVSTQLEGANFHSTKLEGADFSWAKLEEAFFFDARLEGAIFRDVELLKAEQLIEANNIYGIKNCPEAIIEKIKEYGCISMLTKRPEKWSKKFIKHRQELISKWNTSQQ